MSNAIQLLRLPDKRFLSCCCFDRKSVKTLHLTKRHNMMNTNEREEREMMSWTEDRSSRWVQSARYIRGLMFIHNLKRTGMITEVGFCLIYKLHYKRTTSNRLHTSCFFFILFLLFTIFIFLFSFFFPFASFNVSLRSFYLLLMVDVAFGFSHFAQYVVISCIHLLVKFKFSR